MSIVECFQDDRGIIAEEKGEFRIAKFELRICEAFDGESDSQSSVRSKFEIRNPQFEILFGECRKDYIHQRA